MLQVNVAQLHEDNREALSLAWVAGREARTEVRRESAAAAALVGHLNLTHPNSVQVIGAYEAASVAGFAERLFGAAPAAWCSRACSRASGWARLALGRAWRSRMDASRA